MGFIIRNLSKSYGGQTALDAISLDLPNGIIALLGANGSGKSTLLRILSTLLHADQGTIVFDGFTYPQHQRQLRTSIGYLPQDVEFPDALTPRRLLTHLATLRKADPEPILNQLALDAIADRPFSQLSKGQIRLVAIAQAFLGSPRLLLLDEPLKGLDMRQRERVLAFCRQQSSTIIFSTHIPNEIEAMNAQTVIILKAGRVLFCDTPEQLSRLAVGFVHEICLSVEAFQQLSPSFIISHQAISGEWMKLRIVGPIITFASEKTPVAPSLEDSYLFISQITPQSGEED